MTSAHSRAFTQTRLSWLPPRTKMCWLVLRTKKATCPCVESNLLKTTTQPGRGIRSSCPQWDQVRAPALRVPTMPAFIIHQFAKEEHQGSSSFLSELPVVAWYSMIRGLFRRRPATSATPNSPQAWNIQPGTGSGDLSLPPCSSKRICSSLTAPVGPPGMPGAFTRHHLPCVGPASSTIGV